MPKLFVVRLSQLPKATLVAQSPVAPFRKSPIAAALVTLAQSWLTPLKVAAASGPDLQAAAGLAAERAQAADRKIPFADYGGWEPPSGLNDVESHQPRSQLLTFQGTQLPKMEWSKPVVNKPMGFNAPRVAAGFAKLLELHLASFEIRPSGRTAFDTVTLFDNGVPAGEVNLPKAMTTNRLAAAQTALSVLMDGPAKTLAHAAQSAAP